MNWDEWRGSLDGRPTMWIKRLVKLPFWRRAGKVLSCRVDLHKFVAPDDIGCYHTHPAWAIRIPLWNGYIEEIESGEYKTWRPGMIGIVRPRLSHRVAATLRHQPSYSLWIRGPICAGVDLRGPGWDKQRDSASGQDSSKGMK